VTKQEQLIVGIFKQIDILLNIKNSFEWKEVKEQLEIGGIKIRKNGWLQVRNCLQWYIDESYITRNVANLNIEQYIVSKTI